ncbi:MAG: PspC domain-containing protein [Clostridia bacterium]|nr:PspC domain-containing protein [Clostridia bacterium]
MSGKKLYKSVNDRKLAGVCGGIAEYLDLDSTIVRLALVVFTLAGGSGLLFYIIAAIVMQDDPGYGNV